MSSTFRCSPAAWPTPFAGSIVPDAESHGVRVIRRKHRRRRGAGRRLTARPADRGRRIPGRAALSVLDRVEAPTLLIVGGADYGVIELNEQALARLRGPKALEIVPGASHLFPEPGALEAVVDRARRWFERYLGMDASAAAPT